MNRTDLQSKSLPELKQMCRGQNIFFSPDDGKEDLIDLLLGAVGTPGAPTTSNSVAGFGNISTDGNKVNVASGASASQFNVAGLNVGQIKEKLMDALNIDPEAAAILNGDVVNNSATVRAGDSLEFIKRAGKKGQDTDETVNSNVEVTTMEISTPTVAVLDGKTYLCNMVDNTLKNAFVVGNPMAISQQEMYDFIELTLMGNLFDITISQLAQVSTRNLSPKEVQDWNIAVATYQRADTLKDKYLLVQTVNQIK